jgi:hypothetical protein
MPDFSIQTNPANPYSVRIPDNLSLYYTHLICRRAIYSNRDTPASSTMQVLMVANPKFLQSSADRHWLVKIFPISCSCF